MQCLAGHGQPGTPTSTPILILKSSGAVMKRAIHRLRQDPSTLTCSTCGRKFLLDETETPPFCSERCKLVDLGRWMEEEIGLPHEGGPANAEGFEPQAEDEV